jgi:hypothetical protein
VVLEVGYSPNKADWLLQNICTDGVENFSVVTAIALISEMNTEKNWP